jgi:1-deoxy-D-xylulose-5-phosphate reductoisomerase
MQTISILGATGSIGQSTLAVLDLHPHAYRVFGVSGHSQYQALIDIACRTQAQHVVLTDVNVYADAKAYAQANQCPAELHCGAEALAYIATADAVDSVMAAIVGAAGLAPTFAAVQAGKRVLLANKEALVMTGDIFISAANVSGAQILPIDSEHNAIFQCLPSTFRYGDLADSGIAKILLTGSGGPFLHTPLSEFDTITPAHACAHPNWSMGQKISVDSATMMNKGLEFIEAKWLFGLDNADIEIVLHPQSTIHSMVQYVDGSVIAQMGQPDMRTPIAHALSYPNLYLALNAAQAGQSMCTTLNASNEIAVRAFLDGQIGFTDIARVNEQVMAQHEVQMCSDIAAVLEFDTLARRAAQLQLEAIAC